MIRQIIILAVLTVMLAATAGARRYSYRQNTWEFSLRTSYLTSQDVETEGGSSLSLQDNLGWGFGFAYNFNQHFNLGVDFSWQSINYTAVIVDGSDPDLTEEYSSRLDTSTWALTGNYHILKGPFTPYVTGSLGGALIDTNIFSGWGSVCWWDPWWGYMCSTHPTTYGKTTISANLGLGGRFDLTQHFFVRAGYEYNWLGLDEIDGKHMFRTNLGLQF